MIDLDDGAGRQLVLEELHARGDDVFEFAHVGRVDDDRHDIVERAAGRFQHRLHVADGLPRLLGHVAVAHQFALAVARQLAGEKDQRLRIIDPNVVVIDARANVRQIFRITSFDWPFSCLPILTNKPGRDPRHVDR